MNFARKISPLLFVVLFSLPTFWSLLRPGYFKMHDDMQAMRVYQMDKCVSDFQIPCRWVPDMGYGYGYPQFNYYGPLPYYVMEGFHLLGLGYFDAVKIGFILPLVFGNLAMYLLGRKLFGKAGGFLSAFSYAYLPYRASDLYSRGAMGESWAFIFLPLIIFALLKLTEKPNLKSSAFLALSLAGLFCSHNITSLIFAPFAAILFLVFLSRSKISKLQSIKFSVIGAFWGVAIAGFFLFPVIIEKPFAHVESMLSGYFNYLAHFVTLKQLFLSTFWGYGSSELGNHDDLSFSVGFIQLLLLALALSRSIRKRSPIFITIFALSLAAFFMTHVKSSFIWGRVSLLSYLQFPWRFLTLAGFFTCLGSGFLLINQKLTRIWPLFFSLLVVIFLTNASFFTPSVWYSITEEEKFSGASWDKQMTISIFDYLPIYASHPPTFSAPINPTGQGLSFLNIEAKSNSLSFTVYATASSSLTLPQFDFPGWKITLNNQIITHNHNNELGLINFTLPSGTNQVTAKLTDTPVRVIGNFSTLVFLPLSIYFLISKKYHYA